MYGKQKSAFFRTFECGLFFMRKTGLEPVRCEPHAPQTCASASSATSACDNYVNGYIIHDCGGFVKRNFDFSRKKLPRRSISTTAIMYFALSGRDQHSAIYPLISSRAILMSRICSSPEISRSMVNEPSNPSSASFFITAPMLALPCPRGVSSPRP